jgi:hypothetical protein
MRFGFLVALPVVLLMGQLTQAQLPDALKAAYETNQVFALRDAVSHSPVPLFYRGAVNASSNSVQAAESTCEQSFSVIHTLTMLMKPMIFLEICTSEMVCTMRDTLRS